MDAQLGFYAAAAQVLPILFIALIFEQRILDLEGERRERLVPPPGGPTRRLVIRLIVSAFLVLAESVALRVLITANSTGMAGLIVVAGLALSLVLLAGLPIERLIKRHLDDLPPWVRAHPGKVSTVVGLIFVVSALLPLSLGVDFS